MRGSTILMALSPCNRYKLCVYWDCNAVSVVLLIAQGWRAKAKSTLGYLSLEATTL